MKLLGRISKTEPLDRTNFELVLATAQAGKCWAIN
jgi:hypothetical protein